MKNLTEKEKEALRTPTHIEICDKDFFKKHKEIINKLKQIK